MDYQIQQCFKKKKKTATNITTHLIYVDERRAETHPSVKIDLFPSVTDEKVREISVLKNDFA